MLNDCCYCDHAIDFSGYDWGWTTLDYGIRMWHEECFMEFEEIVLWQ
jgi:hypothetical protein